MEVLANSDRRSKEDKRYDVLFDRMVRSAKLNPRQSYIVREYLRGIVHEKIQEVEDAMSIAFLVGLIELYKFGCNKTATRLPKLHKYVREILNDAYGHDCINANGQIEYDNCGLARLKNRLHNHGVKFVDTDGTEL